MKKILLLAMTLSCGIAFGQDLVITAVYDAPLTGGTPKGIELYATDAIADLSLYGVSAAANGGGTSTTPVFELSGSATSGQYIYVASESTQFANWFGFSPDFTSGEMGINGDDAIELFYDAVGDGSGWGVIDVFGEVDTDGTGQAWEYTDGWAYRNDETGPDGSTFTIGNWTLSGINALDGESTNATATSPIPSGTYVDVVTSNTKIKFSASSGTADELDGSVILTISIENESASIATSVDVELTSGSATDLGNYTTQTVTFPANTSSNQTVSVTITDNSDLEGSKDFVFTLTSATGGTSAEVSSPSTFGLTLTDDDTPDIIINEIQADPDATNGDANNDGVADTGEDEFIEIVNNESSSLDISGWVLADGASNRHTFPDPTIIPAGKALVLFGGGSPSGSFGGSLVQTASSGSIGLNNGGDNIILTTDGGAEVLNITYGSDAGDNQSITLDADLVGTFTKHSLATGSGGALFSPGTKIDGTVFVATTSITWDGSEDNDWNNPDNWSGGVIPSSNDNVVITDVANDPILSAGDHAAVNNLTVNSGAVLSVDSGGSLAIFGSVTNNGTCYFEKALGDNGYSIIGSPVASEAINGLGTDHFYSNTNGGGFSSNLKNSTDVMTPGRGYFAAYDGASQYPVFEGSPNTGDITYTPSASSGFELIANPYTAAISTTKFLADNSSVITGGVYFWDDGGSNVGGDRGGDYIAVTALGAASAVQPSGSDDGVGGNKGDSRAANGYIPSVQGVFVEVTSTSNITFSQSQQVIVPGSNVDDNYYREAGYQKVKLAMSGNGLYNEVLIGLGEDATYGVDRLLDAKKFSSGNALSFYSLIEEEKYVIQGLPLANTEVVIAPLGFDLTESGTFEMSVIDLENIPENMRLTLTDHATGISYDLRNTESFTFSSEEVENDKRFELQFSLNEVLSVEDPSEELSIFGNASELTITSGFEGSQEVAIYSLDGKIAFNERVNFTNHKAVIKPSLTQNKVYILRVGDQSFKFVIQ